MSRDQVTLLACWLVLAVSVAGAAMLVGAGVGAAVDHGFGWLVALWAAGLLGAAFAAGYVEERHNDRD